MKTLLYFTILLTTFIYFIIGLGSCKKCPSTHDKKTWEYREEDDNNFMNFTGSETLTYLKNNKDTVRFNSMGLQNYYTMETIPAGESENDIY